MAQHQQQQHQHEFLPLCDVLFNIISLASYFCDVVFDLAMGYALAHHSTAPPAFFPLTITLVLTSLIVSQVVSIRWYLWGARGKLHRNTIATECNSNQERKASSWVIGCVLLLHSTQVGVLWRYFKLFIPVDLAYVKHEVRELCVLRLIHAFCEAAPMLLLQLYLLSTGITGENEPGEIGSKGDTRESGKLIKLTAVSAGLSLWSVCWAVASFSKGAARLRNLERLVLTWLGVLAQLVWRLGTVSARVGALVAYASVYGSQWLLIVLALHWLSMFTWLLLTPDGLFHGGERLPLPRKAFLASLLAFVYIFAYVNLHETNHRQKMVIFYTVMFLENSLLVGVWAAGVNRNDLHPLQYHPQPVTLALTLLALFFGGLFFMGLYYRFFHVRRLRYETGGRMNTVNVVTTLSKQDAAEDKQIDYTGEKKVGMNMGMRRVKLSNGGIPGVFNCRFVNPAVTNPNRKKKKPTTFVPPPPPQPQATSLTITATAEARQRLNGSGGSRQLIPFWRRPPCANALPQAENGIEQRKEAEVGVGGSLSVNLIHEKLREKKQQQLRELRAIQEEIKEGKLVPPPSASTSSFSSSPSASNQQSPPNTKLHTSPSSLLSPSPPSLPDTNDGITLSSWPPVKMHCLLPPPPSSPYYPNSHPSNLWKVPQRERADTPEILLAPRCLPHHYPHWTPPSHLSHRLRSNHNGEEESSKGDGEGEDEVSDMEGSQVSLPRSYTLPREFKYNNSGNLGKDRERRGGGSNKPPPSRFYLPSTNSSDGDVDSADNEEETDSELQIRAKNNHVHNGLEESRQRRYTFENEMADPPNPNPESTNSRVISSPGCFLNSTYGVPRSNQLLRAKVKHETKL